MLQIPFSSNCFSTKAVFNSTSFLQWSQKQILQFLQGPSVQGSGKPQDRGRAFLFKIGEGKDGRQPVEGMCKHRNEVTTVKLTPKSILTQTSREGQPRHGRTGELTDQYGLPMSDKTIFEWNPIRYSLRGWKPPLVVEDGIPLQAPLACLVRPDSRPR